MSDKKPKTIDASCPVSFMGCEGEVIVEMTPTEAVLMIEKAWQENKRLRQENASLTAERDEARHGEAVATATLYGMIEERTALRAERDEARREVCVRMQQTGFLRGDYAAERGWDCYKKEPNDIEAHEVRGDVAGPEGAD